MEKDTRRLGRNVLAGGCLGDKEGEGWKGPGTYDSSPNLRVRATSS